jgi:hypothetical protein
MTFQIPSKFQLGGSTIEVAMVDQITGEGRDIDGMAMYAKRRIELKNDPESTKQYKEWVFFHEVVHHIFNAIGESDMMQNEKLVDQIALLLHQAIVTME